MKELDRKLARQEDLEEILRYLKSAEELFPKDLDQLCEDLRWIYESIEEELSVVASDVNMLCDSENMYINDIAGD